MNPGKLNWLLAALAVFALTACSGDEAQMTAKPPPPQPITDGDTCHVCGMFITEFEGPKGQAFMQGHPDARKFCSTLEMFVFLQQPENQTQLRHAYVHDIGVTPWAEPGDNAYILAEKAWYVVGHDRRGSMGHTLAPFSSRERAMQFIEAHGGEIIAYEAIDLTLLVELGRGETSGHTTHSKAE